MLADEKYGQGAIMFEFTREFKWYLLFMLFLLTLLFKFHIDFACFEKILLKYNNELS